MITQAVGIDIGKDGIYVCVHTGAKPKKLPVHILKYKDDNWYLELLKLIEPSAVVALEPTGWHYMKPIITVLHFRAEHPHIIQVNNQMTANIRKAHVSSAKNDMMDARALAVLAQMIVDGTEVRGTKDYHHERTMASLQLRHLVNRYRRQNKARVRVLNQIDAFAHGIYPTLAIKKDTYLKLLALDAIAPREIKALVANPPSMDGRKLYPIKVLADKLPDIDVDPVTRDALVDLFEEYQRCQEIIETVASDLSILIEQPPFTEITERWRTAPFLSKDRKKGQNADDFAPIAIASFHVATNGQADIYTPDEFRRAVGWYPQTNTSSSIDRTAKGKSGYRPAMDAIHTYTILLIGQKDNPISDYFARTTSNKKKSACAGKLSRILSGIARNPNGSWQKGKQS